ncbi:MAG: prepilin-type N-terminal cleavage/methylation domain-containing protein [Pseudomonadota bacterium]
MENKGFTLIETLVAVMILAISMTVIFQLFSGGLKNSLLVGNYTRACFYAREKMEEFLLLNTPPDVSYSGDLENGYKWQVQIDSVVPEDGDQPATNSKVNLQKITVTIHWDEGFKEKQFDISTIKIAEKTENG